MSELAVSLIRYCLIMYNKDSPLNVKLGDFSVIFMHRLKKKVIENVLLPTIFCGKLHFSFVGFEVLTTANVKGAVSMDVTTCTLVDITASDLRVKQPNGKQRDLSRQSLRIT